MIFPHLLNGAGKIAYDVTHSPFLRKRLSLQGVDLRLMFFYHQKKKLNLNSLA